MQCFVENVKEGEILEGFRIDLPAVVEQILPLLLRDFERSPDVLKEPLILQFAATVVSRLKVEKGGISDAASQRAFHRRNFVVGVPVVASSDHVEQTSFLGAVVGVLLVVGRVGETCLRFSLLVSSGGAAAHRGLAHLGSDGRRSSIVRAGAGDHAGRAGERAWQRAEVQAGLLRVLLAVCDAAHAVGRERDDHVGMSSPTDSTCRRCRSSPSFFDSSSSSS